MVELVKNYEFVKEVKFVIRAMSKEDAIERLNLQLDPIFLIDTWHWNIPESIKEFKLKKISRASLDEKMDYWNYEIKLHEDGLNDKSKQYRKWCKSMLEFERSELNRLIKLKKEKKKLKKQRSKRK